MAIDRQDIDPAIVSRNVGQSSFQAMAGLSILEKAVDSISSHCDLQ
ncbi:MAG: hypothetical protein J7641_13915 [Cyanobacteria bacterium SID2]|nr:hypothetical protein [Cyanobacteria bacterium SID2]MBP0002802.1 hypothetical protein [Cyanobacteria bacterium SBC]